MIKAVLFDLDGTFADTAPDLANALNCVRQEKGLSPLPLESIRLETSNGANALIKLGFEIETSATDFSNLKNRLLDHYLNNIAEYTTLFAGIDELIKKLEERSITWGIVTNKPMRFTNPLMEKLGISDRTHCIVSGDTTSHAKPHPESLIYATKLLGISPRDCLYIGDAARDISAARNAGMRSLIAMYGYIGLDDQTDQWGADGKIDHPLDILSYLSSIE